MEGRSKELAGEVGGEILNLKMEGKDVYNPTAPFEWEGETLMMARVESRDSETDSKSVFFKLGEGGEWRHLWYGPEFMMQDPFVCKIGSELVIGGVEVDWKNGGGYKSIFYCGEDIYNLACIASGPQRMKDIRFVQLIDGGVGIFTRPQGEIGGRGKIGFTRIESLRELNAQAIESAKLIENQFADGWWGGVNQAVLLQDGRIGVLGHVACFEEDGGKRYSGFVFEFDPVTRASTKMRVISVRENFPETEAKRDDLKRVVFPGGIVLENEGWAKLYAGLSDTTIGVMRMPYPWR